MRILLTCMTLQARSGAILSTRDLAVGLHEEGDEVFVYSPTLGPLAEDLRGRGVSVVDSLSELLLWPDLIHGHHHIETIQTLLRFPEVPGLFAAVTPRHGATHRHCIQGFDGSSGSTGSAKTGS